MVSNENWKLKIFPAQEFILNTYGFVPIFVTIILYQVLLFLLISLHNGCDLATRGECTHMSDRHLSKAFSNEKDTLAASRMTVFSSSSFPFSACMIHQLPSLFHGRDKFMKPELHDHALITITLIAAFTLPHGSCVQWPSITHTHGKTILTFSLSLPLSEE